jgi:peptidyl-prolyl cis-trans isomerase D
MVQAAFATRESTESDLLETPKGEYFVVRTDRVTPARVPALSEVDGKVTEAWQSDERRKLADAKVKEALGKAIAGGDLAAIAKELGVQVETSKPVSRYDTDPASHLAQPATQELFKLAVGKSQSAVGRCRSRPNSTPSRGSTRPASRSSSRPSWWPTSRRRSPPI